MSDIWLRLLIFHATTSLYWPVRKLYEPDLIGNHKIQVVRNFNWLPGPQVELCLESKSSHIAFPCFGNGPESQQMINEPLIQKSLEFIWVKQIHKPDQCDHFGLPQLDAYPDEIHQKNYSHCVMSLQKGRCTVMRPMPHKLAPSSCSGETGRYVSSKSCVDTYVLVTNWLKSQNIQMYINILSLLCIYTHWMSLNDYICTTIISIYSIII